MNHNEYSLSQIIASLKWYARVASKIGHCFIPDDEINAYLKAFKELTEENERLRERNIVLEQKFIILDREEIPVLRVKVKGE